MNRIENTGIYYTQIAEDLPIEERIFFRAAVGKRATAEYFRPATEAELAEWEEYKNKNKNKNKNQQ